MSRNHKNNHYHYAEKFDDRRRRPARANRAYMPFKSVIISLAVLLMFGLVCTTFATYVYEEQPESNPEAHPIISEIRNLKASRDISYTGAGGDWASTGGNISGGTVYVELPSTWNTGSYSHVQMVQYQNGYSSTTSDFTHITGTNIWYGSALSHGSWNNETVCFIANSSSWSSNSWDPATQGCTYYTSKITQPMTSGKHYFFTVSGSSNPYTNTATRIAKDSAKAAVGVYDQTAHVRTKSTAANGYEHSGTGGNVTVTASWLNLENGNHKADQGTTPSSDGGTSQTYSEAMWHTPVTFNATANTGYRFVGWFESESATTAKSTSTSYTLTNSLTGANELYARFIKRVTVTASQSPSGYSGTAPTVGGSSSKTVDIGESVALDAHTTTGITAVWKNGSTTVLSSSTGNYTPTDSVTLTANYTLTAPTFTSYSYTTPITVGNTSNITKTVSSATGSNTGLSYTYTAAAVNSTASDAAAVSSVSDPANVFDSSGNFTPTVPGEYKITVSVKDTAKGLTSASVSKDTVIVRVRPAAPTVIAHDVSNKDSGSGLKTDPYMVPVNSTNFTIRCYIPVENRDANCTYNWTRTDGIYNTSTTVSTPLGHTATITNSTEVTDISSATATDVIHNAVRGNQAEIYYYKVSVTAQRNGVESEPFSPFDDPTSPLFYYSVTNNFLVVEEFDFRDFNSGEPIQKVYAEDNEIESIHAKYKAGGTEFKTMLWYSTDNIEYREVAAWFPNTFRIINGEFANPSPAAEYSPLPNDAEHQVSALQNAISVFARNSVNLMSVAGPKWFKGTVEDTNNPPNTRYPELHTTVGTSSAVSDRPVYYVDATANQSYTDGCRVMAFYTQSSDATPVVHYQTAQLVKEKSKQPTNSIEYYTYRFYIPSDAEKITFAHVVKNNYVLPTYNSSGGNLSYSYGSDVLKAWTPTLDLTSSDNYGMTTFKADTPGTATNGVYNYTNTANNGNMTTLD